MTPFTCCPVSRCHIARASLPETSKRGVSVTSCMYCPVMSPYSPSCRRRGGALTRDTARTRSLIADPRGDGTVVHVEERHGAGDPAAGAQLGVVLEEQQVLPVAVGAEHRRGELHDAVRGVDLPVHGRQCVPELVHRGRHRGQRVHSVDRVGVLDGLVDRRGRLGDRRLRLHEGLQVDLAVLRRERVRAELADDAGDRADRAVRHVVDHAGDLAHRTQVGAEERERAPKRARSGRPSTSGPPRLRPPGARPSSPHSRCRHRSAASGASGRRRRRSPGGPSRAHRAPPPRRRRG